VETRIIDLANQVNSLTGNRAGLRQLERRRWDTHDRRRASIEKAQQLLGYQPRTDFATGLSQTLAWLQNHRKQITAAARF
jgi:nucleoside-diphosphate-sugar epimerase